MKSTSIALEGNTKPWKLENTLSDVKTTIKKLSTKQLTIARSAITTEVMRHQVAEPLN